MAAYQAPPSLGLSRQEYWSGLPFPCQCMKVKSESEVAQSCPTLRDPMDCSPSGFSVHGIFQARVLEWGAIAFSDKLLYNPSNQLFKTVNTTTFSDPILNLLTVPMSQTKDDCNEFTVSPTNLCCLIILPLNQG